MLRYAGHRFPIEIISHTVWLYYRFGPSFRDIEELLAAQGVGLTYESIRQWCLKFGKQYAKASAAVRGTWEILGILMKSLFRSKAHVTIFGGPWIRMEMCLIFCCRKNVARRQRSVSFESC